MSQHNLLPGGAQTILKGHVQKKNKNHQPTQHNHLAACRMKGKRLLLHLGKKKKTQHSRQEKTSSINIGLFNLKIKIFI